MKEQKLAFATIAAIAYGIFYVVAWVHRSQCGDVNTFACLTQAAMTAGTDLVLFSWVWGHEQLAAGLLAVVAAGAILLNSSLERRNKERADNERKKQQTIEELLSLELTMRRFAADIHFGANLVDNRHEAAVEATCIRIYAATPALIFLVMYCMQEIRAISSNPNPTYAAKQRRKALAWCAIYVLDSPERNYQGGDFRAAEKQLQGQELTNANSSALSDYDKTRFRGWLKW